jgi:hypothetical protein
MLSERSYLDIQKEEAKLTEIANSIQSHGYEVRRVVGTTYESKEVGNVYINYTNAIFSGNHAIVPRLGVREVDAAALNAYQSLGFKVIQVDSPQWTFCLQGGIRCVSETYRRPVFEGPSSRKAQ